MNKETVHIHKPPLARTSSSVLCIEEKRTDEDVRPSRGSSSTFRGARGVFLFLLLLSFTSTHSIAQTRPNTIPNLVLWLRADSNVTINPDSTVSAWNDCSGKGNNALQGTAAKQPILVGNTINSQPVIQFNGSSNFLLINPLVQTQPVTYFFVWHTSGDGCVIDGENARNLLRYTGGAIQVYAGTLVQDSHSTPFTIISSVIFNGTSSYLFENGIEKASGDFGSMSLDALYIGAEGGGGSAPFLKGYIAEIIMYGSSLSDTDRKTVESYLLNKYSRTVNLGSDIIENDTTISPVLDAGSGFSSYLWNTLASTQTLTVSAPGGLYSVSATDNVFNSISIDTIVVHYPNFSMHDTAYCKGGALSLSTGYSASYTYHWLDGQSTPIATVSTPGNYAVTITNAGSYVAHSNIFKVTEDDFASTVTLGPDTALCSGNSIGLVSKSLPAGLSYQWSTHVTTSKITVSATGPYSVTVTDTNNCVATSSVSVTVSGTAPTPSFSVTSGCASDSLQFTNTTFNPTGDSWLWQFGDGDSSLQKSPKHRYAKGGAFTAQLSASSGICKDTLSKKILVLSKPDAPMLVYPFSAFSESDTIETFRWTTSANTDSCTFELDTNQAFTSAVMFASGHITGDTLRYVFPKNAKKVYWKVIAFNSCGSDTSVINQITFFNPSTIPNMLLWLKVDKGVQSTLDSVSQWNDQSGKGNNAVQTDLVNRPTLIPNYLNGLPTLFFGGFSSKSYMLTPKGLLDGLKNLTMFLTFRAINLNSNSAVFGDNINYGQFDINTNGDSGRVTINGTTVRGVWSGGWENLTIECKPTANNVWENGVNVWANTGSLLPITSDIQQAIGRYASAYGNFYGNFYITEIIIYNVALTDSQRIQIESYLKTKYAPHPIAPGKDITVYTSLCDTTIHAGAGFASYRWNTSTRDSTESIKVGKPGKYTVTVTDAVFGFASTATINVTFATQPHLLTDTTICPGTSIEWDTKLPATNYTFVWSNDSTTSKINISKAGTYSFSVTDKHGCVYLSDTATVTIDTFNKSISLGNDTTLCKNNEISLKKGGNRAVTYLWNDGSINASLEMLQSGTYSLTATDSLGCNAADTVIITLNGHTAPATGFTINGWCQNNSITFIDTSTTQDGSSISSRKWIIGTDTVLNKPMVSEVFKKADTYHASLQINTSGTCSGSKTLPFTVNPSPNVAFSPLQYCQNDTVPFVDKTTLTQLLGKGSIVANTWYIGDTTVYNSKTIPIVFTTAGKVPVTLIDTTDKGCTDSIVSSIEIKASPTVQFTNSASCANQLCILFDQTVMPASDVILLRQWTINGGNGGGNEKARYTNKTTPATVELYIKGVDGCADSLTRTIPVGTFPKAAFTTPNACVGQQVTFMSKSSIDIGTIVEWEWNISDLQQTFDSTVSFTFSQTGTYPVSLRVVSDMGCQDTATAEVNVLDFPKAAFTYTPLVTGAPVNMHFANQSTKAIEYLWHFGDGDTSSEFEPIHIFSDSGAYIVNLSAYNQYNCFDAVSKTIHLSRSNYNVWMQKIATTSNNDFYSVSIPFANTGLNPIESVDFILQKEDGSTVKESWKGLMLTGAVDTFTFASEFRKIAGQNPKYICVTANVTFNNDSTVASFTTCTSDLSQFYVFTVYPVPAANQLNVSLSIPKQGEVTMAIYDNTGREIMHDTYTSLVAGFNTIPIDISILTKGYYVITLSTNNTTISKTFVKM